MAIAWSECIVRVRKHIRSGPVALIRLQSSSVVFSRHQHMRSADLAVCERILELATALCGEGQIWNADSEDSRGLRIGMVSVDCVSGSSNETTVV